MEEKTQSSSPVPFPNIKTGFILLQKGIKVKKSTFITRSNYEEWWPLTHSHVF